MSDDKWCPENDGAYRMEMAAKYKHVEAQKTRLELAAPDMLEALRGMVRLAELAGVGDRIICHAARAALAKATDQ